MSTNLFWERIPTEPQREGLGSLRRILANRIWGSNGSGNEAPAVVGEELLPFLEGLVIGSGSGDYSRDAQKLISAIREFGKVKLLIE